MWLREDTSVLSLKFTHQVGRTPWSAADAPVGLFECIGERDQGVRRGRGRPPHLDLYLDRSDFQEEGIQPHKGSEFVFLRYRNNNGGGKSAGRLIYWPEIVDGE